jgi:ParB family chromosome partitioning protein
MRPAFVQTEFDFEIREINALEARIVAAEDDADAMLWDQARRVVEQLPPHGAASTRKLAAQWINARTGELYSHVHVHRVKATVERYSGVTPRPRFRDAYNEIDQESKAPHVSQNTGNNEWYTPAPYIEAARAVLGAIDLDPASCLEANAIIGASTFYTLEQNGLEQTWRGRVWMNPPYAQPAIEYFAAKYADSVRGRLVTAGIVLVNNATETDWFRQLGDVSTAVCFPTGRVRFWSPDRESAAPLQGQAVLYAGDQLEAFREAFSPFGVVLVKP